MSPKRVLGSFFEVLSSTRYAESSTPRCTFLCSLEEFITFTERYATQTPLENYNMYVRIYPTLQVMVNLDPTEPEKGVVAPKLPSMHNAHGCECETPKVTEMRINHYLGSLGDFYDHSRRYWEVSLI